MTNTPDEVIERSRKVAVDITSVKKGISKSTGQTMLAFNMKGRAITDKVFYDLTIIFYVNKKSEGEKEITFEQVDQWAPTWVRCTCFTGDTLVILADGKSVPISSLVGKQNFYVYSYDLIAQRYVMARGENCEIKEKNAEILEVTLDNGQKIKCTPDHKFLLRDGKTYVEARDLKSGDSLMALYRRIGNERGVKEYEQVLQSDGWEFSHRMADKFNLKNQTYDVSSGTVRHHKDFNKFNNSPENIVRMEWSAHIYLHSQNVAGDRNPMKRKDVRERVRRSNQKNGSFKRTSQRMKDTNPMKDQESLQKMLNTQKQMGLHESKRVKELYKLVTKDGLSRIAEARRRAINSGDRKFINAGHEATRNAIRDGIHHFQTQEHSDQARQRALARSAKGELAIQKNQALRDRFAAVGRASFSKKEKQDQLKRSRAVEIIRKNIAKYGRVMPDQFMALRGYPGYNKIIQNFNIEELIREATNHKVVSVRKLDDKQDVYCFTVPEYGNFVIDVDGGTQMSSGVTVSNCPYFQFYLEYVLDRNGSTVLRKNVTDNKPPKIRNPEEIPYVCKHLYKALPMALAAAKKVK